MGTKTRAVYMLSTKTYFRSRNIYKLKARRWKQVFHANGNQKKARVAILISDKTDFKLQTVTRDKKGHYIMININIHVPTVGAPQ